MACFVEPTIELSQLLPPLVTTGFVSALLTKDVTFVTAVFALYWYLPTYLGFFFEGSLSAVTEFLVWPLVVFALSALFGALVSQIGDYPRLFDYVQILRTYNDAASRIYDRRRTVWEGLVFVMSLFAIYFGAIFLGGHMSDGCIAVPMDIANVVGVIMVIAGIAGLIIVVLVTVFSAKAENIERLRMWKYAIFGLIGIGGHLLMHNLLYAYAPALGIYYGLLGLIPLIVFWISFYWYVSGAHYYDSKRAMSALKALGDDDIAKQMKLKNDELDGFKTTYALTAFVITGGLYNVLAVIITWLVSSLVMSPLWTFVAHAIFTAVAILIVIIVAWLTDVYATWALDDSKV